MASLSLGGFFRLRGGGGVQSWGLDRDMEYIHTYILYVGRLGREYPKVLY